MKTPAVLLPSVLFLCLAGGVPAQTPCHAEFDGNTFNGQVSMGGPNLLLAIKVQVPQNMLAVRLEVFTGRRDGQNTLALWSHDAAGNRPLARLAGGAWNMSPIEGWQGADLDQPQLLTQGTTMWFVWGPQNGAQASVQASGSTLPGLQEYRGSFDAGANWNGPFRQHQWKLRIHCNRSPAHYETFGQRCPSSARTVPQLGWAGFPVTGQSFEVRLRGAPPLIPGFLNLGFSDASWAGIPLPLDLSPVGAPGCWLLASSILLFPVGVDAGGMAAQLLAVPPDPALVGGWFYNQWWLVDGPANPLGLVFSEGGRGRVGN